MYQYDEECLTTFLEAQDKIYKEKVAQTLEEADEFLQDCMAVVLKTIGMRLGLILLVCH